MIRSSLLLSKRINQSKNKLGVLPNIGTVRNVSDETIIFQILILYGIIYKFFK